MSHATPPTWMGACDSITQEKKAHLVACSSSWPMLSVRMSDGSLIADDLLKIAWLEMNGKRRSLIISRSIARWRKLRMYVECQELSKCGVMPSRKLEKMLINE